MGQNESCNMEGMGHCYYQGELYKAQSVLDVISLPSPYLLHPTPPPSKERESLVQEWDDYLSHVKKVRNKSYIELPLSNDRTRVSGCGLLWPHADHMTSWTSANKWLLATCICRESSVTC